MTPGKPLDALCANEVASRLAKIAQAARAAPAGDTIDTGLILLRLMNENGFDVVPRDYFLGPPINLEMEK